jgi:hypothetical protein
MGDLLWFEFRRNVVQSHPQGQAINTCPLFRIPQQKRLEGLRFVKGLFSHAWQRPAIDWEVLVVPSRLHLPKEDAVRK